ncbi:hypothetical protein MKEN_01025200 [Mycena kentingensis (nom. inval.)]|nr:hypothetical protein MKEN_01025200 [Mycena kentingensis (nom. inval.)]
MSVYDTPATNEHLRSLPLHVLSTAKNLLRVLKNDIILVQPSAVETSIAPSILPPAVVLFIQDALGITSAIVESLWDIARDQIWMLPYPTLSEEEHRLVRIHGWPKGITAIKLYPPSQTCMTAGCVKNGKPLKKEHKSQAVVYTVADGVQPAYQLHLTCTECRVAFHNNFAVKDGTRTYYPGQIPQFLQVGEHQYVERKLAGLWLSLMFCGWVSATNCAQTYDLSLAGSNVGYMAQFGWQFGTRLTTEHVWDAFIVLTLLDHRQRHGRSLTVPHTGEQAERFMQAMAEHNAEVVNYGNNAVNHCCDKCLRKNTKKRDETIGDVQVIVGDGLSIGRPVCGVAHCPKPLANTRDRFCSAHQDEENYCSITGCRRKIIPKTKSCDIPEHQEMERLHYEHISASTTLGERLQRHRQRHQAADVQARDPEVEYTVDNAGAVQITVSPHPGTVGVSDELLAEREKELLSREAVSIGSVPDAIQNSPSDASSEPTDGSKTSIPDPPCEATKSSAGKKFKAKFNTSRSHTEFFVSYASRWSLRRHSPYLAPVKPEHFVYDSNCDASQQVQAHPEQWVWFQDVGMSVDVFHFLTKHSETHFHCQEFCNPKSFPELVNEDGTWFFNSSVAEQNNSWLGGFQSIVRQMTAVKYDFFLNEMIRLHNEKLLAELNITANARLRV